MHVRVRPLAFLAAALLPLSLAMPGRADATVDVCGPSAGQTLCLKVPDGPLSGEAIISATKSATTAATVEFFLDGQYLNFEYQKPYSFVWPTDRELDGVHTLSARIHQGSTYGEYVSTEVVLANGNLTGVPTNPSDYQSLFQPRQGNLIAALGNGGAEKPAEKQLIDYIRSQNLAAFLYLGEVHEFGTWATTRDHYGLADFDDPSGQGTLYGRMASYTLATPGNHQRDYMGVYNDYWHHRPLWSTEVVNGVRIYDLTSECKANGGCWPNGAQGKWLSAQLAANTEPCIISMWHRPVVSVDKKRSGGTSMLPTWEMLANGGGDLVLNADTRDMEEVLPMNADLQTGQPDSHMVELISGAAAARWVASATSDARVAWRLYKVPGAVFVRAEDGRLAWDFRSSTGQVLRSGSVSC